MVNPDRAVTTVHFLRAFGGLVFFATTIPLMLTNLKPRHTIIVCIACFIIIVASHWLPNDNLLSVSTLVVVLIPILLSFSRTASSTMAPRVKLRWLWVVMRFYLFGSLVMGFNAFISLRIYSPKSVLSSMSQIGLMFVNTTLGLLGGFLFKPRYRGAVHRWLGALGKSSSQQQEAASVAALIGGSGRSAVSALDLAERHFRALDVAVLTEDELMDNKPSPELFAKTAPAKMGEVSAFVSHSWSDSGTTKFERLQEWAGMHRKSGACNCWLDKACIDQTNIDANLACLPVFLASCDSLLVLAGPTYASRLWCVMELFVYLRMGGRTEDVHIRLLDDSADLARLLSSFDAGKARCFLDDDRHKLLAVIEASFGTFDPFNKIVRGIFQEKIVAEKVPHE